MHDGVLIVCLVLGIRVDDEPPLHCASPPSALCMRIEFQKRSVRPRPCAVAGPVIVLLRWELVGEMVSHEDAMVHVHATIGLRAFLVNGGQIFDRKTAAGPVADTGAAHPAAAACLCSKFVPMTTAAPGASARPPAQKKVALLTKVARMYHERGMTQPEIAEQLNLSQS